MATRYSPMRGRNLTRFEAVAEKFVGSDAGIWVMSNIAPRVDRWLIPRTDGKWSFAGKDLVGMLTVKGAKSGVERSQPLAIVPDWPDVILIGSNYGREKHPAWSYNLIANPECSLTFQGETKRYVAECLEGDERDKAFAQAVDFGTFYAGYEKRCAPRVIRVFRLRPLEGSPDPAA